MSWRKYVFRCGPRLLDVATVLAARYVGGVYDHVVIDGRQRLKSRDALIDKVYTGTFAIWGDVSEGAMTPINVRQIK